MVVLAGVGYGLTVTGSGGLTERWANSSGTTSTKATSAGYEQSVSTGDTGTRTLTLGSSRTWITHSLVLNPAGAETLRYGYSADGDTPDLIQDHNGNLVEYSIPLPGGVLYTATGPVQRWSHPNLHGDILATTDHTGTKQGGTYQYSPYGEPVTTNPDATGQGWEYGWVGQHQRPTETTLSLPLLEMGARVYAPALGRFLSVDPIFGGNANNYEYCYADPINCYDLDGHIAFVIALPWLAAAAVKAAAVVGGVYATVRLVQIGAKAYNAKKSPRGVPGGERGQRLKKTGADLLGRKHSEAAKKRWQEWWNGLSSPDKRAYRQAKGPRPRK